MSRRATSGFLPKITSVPDDPQKPGKANEPRERFCDVVRFQGRWFVNWPTERKNWQVCRIRWRRNKVQSSEFRVERGFCFSLAFPGSCGIIQPEVVKRRHTRASRGNPGSCSSRGFYRILGRSAKRKLARLVKLSYDPGADVTDADAPETRWIKKKAAKRPPTDEDAKSG